MFNVFFSSFVSRVLFQVFIGIMWRCLHIFAKLTPLPYRACYDMYGPTIMGYFCGFCSSLPSCPFASAPHIVMWCLGMYCNGVCTSPQCFCRSCALYFVRGGGGMLLLSLLLCVIRDGLGRWSLSCGLCCLLHLCVVRFLCLLLLLRRLYIFLECQFLLLSVLGWDFNCS